jgi:hypothetical protein
MIFSVCYGVVAAGMRMTTGVPSPNGAVRTSSSYTHPIDDHRGLIRLDQIDG